MKLRGAEQAGAAVAIGQDEARESLGRLRGRLDAERGEASLAAQLLDRVVDPAVDRLGEIGRQVRRSPHAPPGTEIELRKSYFRHGRNLRRKQAACGAGHRD